jgi:hypothetical protein
LSWKGNIIDSYLLPDKLERDLHEVLVQHTGEEVLDAAVEGTSFIEAQQQHTQVAVASPDVSTQTK